METVKLKLPTSLQDINIGTYQKYYTILNKHIELKEKYDEDYFWEEVIKLFTGIDATQDDISLTDFNILKKKLAFLTTSKLSFDIKYVIEVDGVKYGLKKDIHNISFNEWNDAKNYYINQEDQINKIHFITAILYRPIKKMINEEKGEYILHKHDREMFEYNARHIQEHLSIQDVYGASVFFWNFSQTYVEILANSLTQEMQQTISQSKIPMEELRNFLNSPKGQDLLKSITEKNKKPGDGLQ